ncbi:MAG: hypothetical protein RLZZ450_291 [Pseudomonadota bacterium]|jgi:hypothetical protein
MASNFNFKTVFFAGLLLGGCSSDMAPQGDDQQTSGATAQTNKDAGKADAGKADAGAKADAGKKDAGSSADDEGDETTDGDSDETADEPTDEAPQDEGDEPAAPIDAGTTKVDAGTKADAGATKADAGGVGAGGDCTTLTYEAFGKSFLDTYCITCHGAAMKPTFKTLAEVTTNKAKMKAEVTTKAMPPKGQKAPTDEERAEFAKFIDCGPK